jgi:hypothetical protein
MQYNYLFIFFILFNNFISNNLSLHTIKTLHLCLITYNKQLQPSIITKYYDLPIFYIMKYVIKQIINIKWNNFFINNINNDPTIKMTKFQSYKNFLINLFNKIIFILNKSNNFKNSLELFFYVFLFLFILTNYITFLKHKYLIIKTIKKIIKTYSIWEFILLYFNIIFFIFYYYSFLQINYEDIIKENSTINNMFKFLLSNKIINIIIKLWLLFIIINYILLFFNIKIIINDDTYYKYIINNVKKIYLEKNQ